MADLDRRRFLQLAGGAAAFTMLSESVARAAAIPAQGSTGTIQDIEHIVVLMQENRSFDHYFGAMKGVRGFGDPRPVTLPSGKSVWNQSDGSKVTLPFRPTSDKLGMEYLQGLNHDWAGGQSAFNKGKYDNWVPAKTKATMAHLTREDIPFHYALADAFTICDAYHCSFIGATDPNRYYMWTGYVGNDGKGGGPVLNNAEAGYGWTTYPERLEAAGVSWKIDLVRGVTVLLELAVDPEPQAQRLRVGHLVGGDEPGAERVEGLAVLALVPGAAALDLELALGHVVGDRVPGDVREGLLVGLQVAGGAADDDRELHLPVGLHRAARDEHGVVRADDGVGGLEEDDRLGGGGLAGLGGVPVVVQPDAHDLADPGDRRAHAQPGRVERGQHTGTGGGPDPVQGGGVGEQTAVDVVDQRGQVAKRPVLVEQGGTLGSGRADTQQLHGLLPVVEAGPGKALRYPGRWSAAIGGLVDPPRERVTLQDPVHPLDPYARVATGAAASSGPCWSRKRKARSAAVQAVLVTM